MAGRKIRLCCLLLALVLVLAGCGPGAGDGGERKEKIVNDPALEEQVEKLVETMGFSGSILVGDADGIRFAAGYGTADGEGTAANTALTSYAVGSITKQFTGAAILQLVEEGKLSLSDPLSRFFPDWPADRVVTVAQMLHMESGLERDFWNIAYREYGYTTMAEADEFQLAPHTEEELWDLLLADELHFAPGSQYQYSNINYYLLGRIVGLVSGMSYQDYIRQHFFEPLGLTGAGIDFPEDIAPGHYAGERTTENADLYEGCGTISCNVYDLYDWTLALHGGEVLDKAAYRVMTTTSVGNYGCGLVINDQIIWHNGQLNGYNSYVGYNAETGIVLIVLSNSRTYEFHGTVADFPADEMASLLGNKL